MKDIFERFKEPSSWAGITGLIAVVLPTLDQGYVAYGVAIAAGICGVLSIVFAEKK